MHPASREFIMAQRIDSALEKPVPGEVRVPIRICGNHEAYYWPGVPMANKQTWDSVSASWNGKRYMAVYVRPTGSPANPAAEAAIRTLCPR